jgi:hypothetical protein
MQPVCLSRTRGRTLTGKVAAARTYPRVVEQVRLRGVTVPVTLAVPRCDVRGGLVALHPADDPRRNQPLLRHLAEVLPEHGVAVLLHDRRPATELSGDTVPLRLQAEDAHAVAAALREALGPVPVGFWGWS